ncbi:RIO-like serine/threonine protein kinase [Clostridium acetobutylicum]|uniref:Serine/threonine kinase related protein, inactivated (HRDL motif absent) n=1 Tax=Clostridium acetobutylicum (strain ATCC 824 / DSM 792 / JCM 1419 / IAM 19013 / LMG 5710 / NBRC 13948 / NRRL B-527 / VKM B-1787 / 2291 / W) TaxID=272562 RepID=Q97GG7_CLOAB
MKHKKHKNTIIKLEECTFLGKGHSGSVYLMPDNRVVKIFKNPTSCKEEYSILRRLKDNPYFPKPYEFHNHYMIREYIDGINIDDYIKQNGASEKLMLKLIYFLEYIKNAGFKKVDARFVHVFIQDNGALRVIDPRHSFSKKLKVPYHLLSDLKSAGCINLFWKVLKLERPDLYKAWH